jgi:diguanylate cyclase (GGDEF)-like protein
MFFFAQFGLASQYLWPDSPWLAIHAAPLAILLALAAASLFVDRVLRVSEWSRVAAGLLHAVAVAAVVAGLLGLVEAIDYRLVQTIATLLGPVPMAVILGASVAQLRRGDRAAAYMLVGWSAYAAGAGVLVALLRGWIDATPWTQHAFQIATLIEMGMWLRVLSLRMEEIRETAHRAQIERNTLDAMAHTDPLTGLPNRRGLDQTLPNALAKASSEQMVAVYLLDLDDFKPVNDRLGHEAGDEVLVAVAQRLQALLRTSDTVARLGGDEFVVVASGLHSDAEAQQLGAKLLEGFRRPFIAAGEACHVGLTIGYALAPQDGRDAIQLLQRADGAMYAGKRAGRHNLQRSEMLPAALPA